MEKRFVVSPSGNGWSVEDEGGMKVAQNLSSQQEAIRKGEEMARKEMGMLMIHDEDGRFQETRSYKEE